MIYRFTQPIMIGQTVIPVGDPIILDDPDAQDDTAKAVRDSIEKGLLISDEVKAPKNKKDKTPQ